MSQVFQARVKPLEWEKRFSHDFYDAESPFVLESFGGYYAVGYDGEKWFAEPIGVDDRTLLFESEVAAKTACQNDHDARVMSLLELSPEMEKKK